MPIDNVTTNFGWDLPNASNNLDHDVLRIIATIVAIDTLCATLAPKASPGLTGTPTAPTAGAATNTTQIATTAFVHTAIANLIASAPGALDTLDELAAALGDDANFASTVTNALALKAPLASPGLTGTPTAPTASGGTDTTQIATTAFVNAAIETFRTAVKTFTNKTLVDPVINGCINEQIYAITDAAAFEIDPSNGSIQTITLGASRTPKATNFANGESLTLMVNDGTNYTLTWTDATFGGSGVKWVGGSAPTLDVTNYTVITLWKIAGQVYGSSPGAAS